MPELLVNEDSKIAPINYQTGKVEEPYQFYTGNITSSCVWHHNPYCPIASIAARPMAPATSEKKMLFSTVSPSSADH
jgi:hypothetical protein